MMGMRSSKSTNHARLTPTAVSMPIAVTAPPKYVASCFSMRLTPQATTSMAVVRTPSQKTGSRRPSRQRIVSKLNEEKTNAPNSPKAYISPSNFISPRLNNMTSTGILVAIATAMCGVLNVPLRTAMIFGKKPPFTRARKTWYVPMIAVFEANRSKLEAVRTTASLMPKPPTIRPSSEMNRSLSVALSCSGNRPMDNAVKTGEVTIMVTITAAMARRVI